MICRLRLPKFKIGFQKKKPNKEQNLEFPIRFLTDGVNTKRLTVDYIRGECLD